MLVIQRRAGESVLIGDDVEIEILESGPTRVKLGIVAPAHVLVHRKAAKLLVQQNRAASRIVSFEAVAEVLAKVRNSGSKRSPPRFNKSQMGPMSNL